MMAQKCMLCGKNTIFYVWTSSRDFPREKIAVDENDELMLKRIGMPVCMHCYRKLLESE